MRRNRTVTRSRARRGRAVAASNMEGRHRAGSNSMKGLLGKQLADISDTLARASARRDAEVRRRLTPQPHREVAPSCDLRPPSTNPSLSSDAEATIGSKSGRSVAVAGDRTQPALQRIGQPYPNLPHTTTVMSPSDSVASVMSEQSTNAIIDDNVPTPSLRGGYESDDPKIMLAQFEKPSIAYSTVDDGDDDDDIESMLLQLERLKATHKRAGNDHMEDTAPQMAKPAEGTSLMTSSGAGNVEDDERTRLLAGLGSSSLLSRSAVLQEMEDVHREQLLAEVQSVMPVANETTTHGADDELTEMLADIEARAELRHDRASMKTPKSVEEMPPAVHQGSADNEQEGIEALYNRLMGMPSSSPDLTPSIVERHMEKASATSTVLRPNDQIMPYVIALQLEMAGIQWEQALGWTHYLFSPGLDGYQARREKDAIVTQADKELDEVIQQVLCDKEHYLGAGDRNKIPRRLIVSNIAAGATEEDLEVFFYPLRYAIQGVKVLPIRDPNKGTQIAHLDMLTRQDAIRASFTLGSIFGLIPTLELAEKRDN